MKLLRVLLPIALFLSLATWAIGVPSRFAWPDEGGGSSEQLLAFWGLDDGAVLASPRCAPYSASTSAEITCGNQASEAVFSRDITITRVDLVTGARAAGVDEGCDVDLLVESPIGAGAATLPGVAIFEWGSAEIGRVAGGTLSQTGLSVTVTAGDALKVEHATATVNDYCATSCVCVAQPISYHLLVFGTFD